VPSQRDQLLGSLAVREKMCTQEQIDECLRTQKLSREPAPLGDVLVYKGFLTEAQVKAAAVPPEQETHGLLLLRPVVHGGDAVRWEVRPLSEVQESPERTASREVRPDRRRVRHAEDSRGAASGGSEGAHDCADLQDLRSRLQGNPGFRRPRSLPRLPEHVQGLTRDQGGEDDLRPPLRRDYGLVKFRPLTSPAAVFRFCVGLTLSVGLNQMKASTAPPLVPLSAFLLMSFSPVPSWPCPFPPNQSTKS